MIIPVPCTTPMYVQDGQSTWPQASFSMRSKNQNQNKSFCVRKPWKQLNHSSVQNSGLFVYNALLPVHKSALYYASAKVVVF